MSYEPMEVDRIRTEHGSRIEPRLDQSWSNLDKLRWNAGVMKADTGLTVKITVLDGWYGMTWQEGGVCVGTSVRPFSAAWDAISHMGQGAQFAQAQAGAQ